MLKHSNLADRFNKIYNENLWSSAESVSGTGSELEYTLGLRKWLVEIIPAREIKKIIDAPCGDFNWMRLVVGASHVNYIGIDIVRNLIDKNQKKYGNSHVKFLTGNICEDRLPNGDLIIIRDCLFHLSFQDIDKALKNLSTVEYRYLLTTSHLIETNLVNIDIISGDFRYINLFQAPFNFDPNLVIDRVNDYPDGAYIKKEMVLLEKKNVPTKLSKF